MNNQTIQNPIMILSTGLSIITTVASPITYFDIEYPFVFTMRITAKPNNFLSEMQVRIGEEINAGLTSGLCGNNNGNPYDDSTNITLCKLVTLNGVITDFTYL